MYNFLFFFRRKTLIYRRKFLIQNSHVRFSNATRAFFTRTQSPYKLHTHKDRHTKHVLCIYNILSLYCTRRMYRMVREHRAVIHGTQNIFRGGKLAILCTVQSVCAMKAFPPIPPEHAWWKLQIYGKILYLIHFNTSIK